MNYAFDVLLITHNNLGQTIQCVESLYEHTASFAFHLTVLDDSTDVTPHWFEWFKKQGHDNIQVLHSNKPFKAPDEILNVGLKNTSCPFVVVLTNSTQVRRSWIGSALKIMEGKQDVGVVGFKTIKAKPNGLIENAGLLLYDNEARSIGLDEEADLYSYIYEVDAVGCSCCLFRREAVKDGFDYSAYLPFGGFEDIDFCLQLKERGWKIIYCGYGSVKHNGAVTREKDPDYWDKFYENKKRFTARWKHLLDRKEAYIKAMQ